ncbi:Uncharacterized protein FKW44_023828 [Caligus rogercresseyi]|uniref:Histone-lysine N-methyltransferase SETMAR n=1 Tax=Caligus rogercresseyi TaxID=217165 RepID=A0A7T8GPM0_CALRO|nr:Uncharacterized protein FKW44_023828 [Caligus rogercresseyi]
MILMGFTCKPRRVSITALPAGTTADQNTMTEYLRTTKNRISQPEKDKIRLKDCLLMRDNARPHTATDTREFLTWRDVEPVKHSPYSPDLNLCDSTCSGRTSLGATRRLHSPRAMRRVSEDELNDQLRKLRGH